MAPTAVYEALVAEGFIDPDREEAFYPQEDELVLPPGEDLDAFDAQMVKLDRDGRAALLA